MEIKHLVMALHLLGAMTLTGGMIHGLVGGEGYPQLRRILWVASGALLLTGLHFTFSLLAQERQVILLGLKVTLALLVLGLALAPTAPSSVVGNLGAHRRPMSAAALLITVVVVVLGVVLGS